MHKEQLPLHRAVGKSSLFLFPFLIGGLAAIIDVTAKGFVSGDDPTRQMFGGQFLIGLALAIAAYVALYYRALKHRRKVWLHSGYMLATPLILFESPFSRHDDHGRPGPDHPRPAGFRPDHAVDRMGDGARAGVHRGCCGSASATRRRLSWSPAASSSRRC